MDFPYKPGQNGYYPDPADSRDIPLGAVLAEPGPIPAEYDVILAKLGGQIKVEDQDGSSSCVGQSWAKYAEVLNQIETQKFADLSAKFIYSRIALPGGGAYLRDGAKIVTGPGISPEYLDPSYPATEENMTKKNEDPIVLNAAKVYRAKSYASVPQGDVEAIKQAIFKYHGEIAGSNVTTEGWGYQQVKNRAGYIEIPKTGEQINGHAFYLCGYSEARQAFKLLNSWSDQWGVAGYAWFPYKYVNWLFTGWTLVDAPNELVDAVKNMYNLIRNPHKPEEVYAQTGKVVRHIANLQTLKLGDKEPDRFWIWESKEIPVAKQSDWDSYIEADEIHLDPKD